MQWRCVVSVEKVDFDSRICPLRWLKCALTQDGDDDLMATFNQLAGQAQQLLGRPKWK